jgi:hypothetical protein
MKTLLLDLTGKIENKHVIIACKIFSVTFIVVLAVLSVI